MTRAERRREGKESKLAALRERGIKHYKTHLGERPSGPKFPTTQKEVQAHLTGRYPHLFRDPVNRQERRQWDRFWKLKGKGYTKSAKV